MGLRLKGFFFNLWMSNCPKTIWWKFYLKSIKLFLQFCQTSGMFVGISVFSILFQCLCLSHHHYHTVTIISSISQFSSVAESCPTLCNPRDCSTPGLPVHHQLPKFTQTHVHWVGDAIQPSQPLSSLSPLAFNCSQHQGLFQWVSSSGGKSTGVSSSASVLPMNTQGWSPLGWTAWISLQSKGLSRLLQHHSAKASILQCSAFFMVQLSHPYMTTGKPIAFDWMDLCWQNNVFAF